MTRPALSGCAALLLSLMAGPSVGLAAGSVKAELPGGIDPSARYFFYQHGKAVEMGGPHAYVRRFDRRYDFPAITAALADIGFTVIAPLREDGSRTGPVAAGIASDVRRLLAAGVPPSRITVGGHSRGGMITLVSAAILATDQVRFVVMAGCGAKGSRFFRSYEKFLNRSASALRGRLLSLVDGRDDAAGSCRAVTQAAPALEFSEQILDSGEGHALFYDPDPHWLEPLRAWHGLP